MTKSAEGRIGLVLPPAGRRVKLAAMSKALAKLVAVLKPRRTWFQFRLRTLFVLVTVAAVPCVWLGRRMEAKRRERAAAAELRKLGASVNYVWEVRPWETGHPPGPQWLRKLLGDDFFADVTYISFPCAWGQILGGRMTDASLIHVQQVPNVRFLNLYGTPITDAGLRKLTGLSRLEVLHLHKTNISNSAVRKLQADLPRCEIRRTHN